MIKVYTIRRYKDGKAIGIAKLSSDDCSRFEQMCQKPEGIIRLGAIPNQWYRLAQSCQDEHEDTTVYLD